MIRSTKTLLGCTAILFWFASTHPVAAGPVGVVPGRVLVRPNAGVAELAFQQAIQAHGARQVDELPQINVRVLQVPARALQRVLEALQQNPTLEFAEPDYILEPDAIANDPYFSSQWHLSKISTPAAWDLNTGNSSVKIAILDTGVESSHSDLSAKLVSGWNFYDGNSNTADVHGHGTAVAGTAAASVNNLLGVASVAINCPIMPIRISDPEGYAYESTIAKGLNWAAEQGARVANISFRVSNSSTVKSAAQYFQGKGGVVVVSSGNDGLFDSASDNPYLLTVSATDANDSVTSWSNTGNNVDLAAPGLNILTTYPGNSYAYWSGTSFSAPIVAGAAALVISSQPSLSGAQAADIVRKSADDLGASGWDSQYGWGRLNVQRAVQFALNTAVSVGDTTAPRITITSPAEGAWIGGNTYVHVNATDDRAVTRVELYVDGRLTASSTSAPFTTRWNSRRASSGAHRLQARAFDAAGNTAWSQIITVYR